MTKQTEEEFIAEMDRRMAEGTEMEDLVPVRNVSTVKEARVVFAVRLSGAEMDAISTAAKSQGRTIGDFMRTASLAAAAGEISPDAADRAAAAAQVRDQLRELVATASKL